MVPLSTLRLLGLLLRSSKAPLRGAAALGSLGTLGLL